MSAVPLSFPRPLDRGELGELLRPPIPVGPAVLDRQPGGSGGEVIGSGVPAFAAQFGNTDQAPTAAL